MNSGVVGSIPTSPPRKEEYMKQNKINSVKIAIQAFNTVRDIPYALGTANSDTTCGTKVKILELLLTKLGYSTKVMVCNFNWGELPLPANIVRLATETFGISKHYFLAVKANSTNNKWVNIDPTWDSGLKKLLPIAVWDGRTNTGLAVPGWNVRAYPNQLEIKNRLTSDFAFEFNKWLKKARR